MTMKTRFFFLLAAGVCLAVAGLWLGRLRRGKGPVPVTYVMVCCHSFDRGTRFLVGEDQWDSVHDYCNYDFTRSMLWRIRQSGIRVVGVDFTNPSQWDEFHDHHWPMLENIVRACHELDMQYFLFCGNTAAWTMKYWNEKARLVWENLAQDPAYRRYGFGDDRPMLTIFLPGKDFWAQWERTPQEEKEYLSRFRIGTCQVNDPITPVESDGWGYRNMLGGSSDAARFVCPNSGVPPQDWARVGPGEWRRRVRWCLQAHEYAVLGTYDDTCDSNFWGIADVSGSTEPAHRNDSTLLDPWAYYNIVCEELDR